MARPKEGKSARAKIIEYPRKRFRMPGSIESHASLPSSDARSREIRAYVRQLLTAPQFTSSSRRGQLLAYLVDHTLAGDADKINEYAIGLDVFQRPTTFDPRIESLVRTEFSRLRQRLKEYYAGEGSRDPITIEFPPRSYAANFEFRSAAEAAKPVAMPQLVPAAARPSPALSRRALALSILGIAAVAVAGYFAWKQHAAQLAARQPIRALVVLPFENDSPNHEAEYIADGITDELTNDLAQWRDLRVVARTSAFAFKGKGEDVRQIGRELNVEAVLEGSFTKDGDQIRVTAQLNRTSDGYDLWSHSYDAQSSDLLHVQEEVATAIAAAIHQVGGSGSGSPPQMHLATTNPEALDLYLQAEYQYNVRTPDSLKKAAELYGQAIQKDPDFARAYLGEAYSDIAQASLTTMTQMEMIPKAREAAQKALELDPELGDAHGLLAGVLYTWDRDWSESEIEYRRALDLGAGAETRARYGWSLATRGRFTEAHEQDRLAAEQDPLSETPPFDEFFAYNFERKLDGQKQVLARMLKIHSDFLGAHALTVVMAVQQHDCTTVEHEADWMAKTYPAVPMTQTVLEFAATCEGNLPEAQSRIKAMIATGAPFYQVAIAYALLHDKNNAIDQLNKAADAHEMQVYYLRYDPFFDEERNDPRYEALEKRVGLL
jgi:TolB-like protein/Tfp pilus assembly protein PilF